MVREGRAGRLMGAIALVGLITVACSRKPTMVRITNNSGVDLSAIELSGDGFRVKTIAIPAGGMRDVAIMTRGKSGLAVSFVAQGRTVSTPEQGYFEGGGKYVGYVAITPDFAVSVEFRLAV